VTEKVADANARIDTHEMICAIRYAGINARLGRMEKIMITSTGGMILFMAGLIVTLAMRAH